MTDATIVLYPRPDYKRNVNQAQGEPKPASEDETSAYVVKPASWSVHLTHFGVPHLAGLDPLTYLRLHFHLPSLSQLAADLAKSTHTRIPMISPKG